LYVLRRNVVKGARGSRDCSDTEIRAKGLKKMSLYEMKSRKWKTWSRTSGSRVGKKRETVD